MNPFGLAAVDLVLGTTGFFATIASVNVVGSLTTRIHAQRRSSSQAATWAEITSSMRDFAGGDDEAAKVVRASIANPRTRQLAIDALTDIARAKPDVGMRLRNEKTLVGHLATWITHELNDVDPGRRAGACEIAAVLRLRSVHAAIARATSDSDAAVRVAACRALSSINPDAAVGALLRLVETEGSWASELLGQIVHSGNDSTSYQVSRAISERVRTWAPTSSLLHLLNQGTIDIDTDLALRVLDSEDPDLRRRGAEAIRIMVPDGAQGKRAVELLLGCLSDADERVRLAAVRSLGAYKDEGNQTIMMSLVAALGDSSRVVRYAAAQELSTCTSARFALLEVAEGPDLVAAEAARIALWEPSTKHVPVAV